MDSLTLALPDGDPVVTADTFSAYQAAAASFAVDRAEIAERAARTWKMLALGSAMVAMAGVLSAATVISRHTEHWSILGYNTATGWVGVIQPLRAVAMSLPGPVNTYFLTRYVEMREGFDPVTATANFDAVACMSDAAEQKRYAAWFNHNPTAPQQVFSNGLTRGSYRVVKIKSDPTPQAYAASAARAIVVRFGISDFNSSGDPGSPERLGTAYFNVVKNPKAVRACDPAGLVISDYHRTMDRGSAP